MTAQKFLIDREFESTNTNSLYSTFMHGLDAAILDDPTKCPTEKAVLNLLSYDWIHSTKDLVLEAFALGESADCPVFLPYLTLGKNAYDAAARAILEADPQIGDTVIMSDNFFLSLGRLAYRGNEIHQKVENIFRDNLYIPTSGHGHSIKINHHTLGRAFTGSSVFSILTKYVEEQEKIGTFDWRNLVCDEDREWVESESDVMKTLCEKSPPSKLNESSGFHAYKLYQHEEQITDQDFRLDAIEEDISMEETSELTVSVDAETSVSASGHSSNHSMPVNPENSDDLKMGIDNMEESSEPPVAAEFEKQFHLDQAFFGSNVKE